MIEQAIILGLAAFFITLISMPSFIKKIHSVKLAEIDAHKFKKTLVAGKGGLIFSFAVIIVLLSYVGFLLYLYSGLNSERILVLLAVIVSILIMAFFGIIDDLLKLRWRYKIILPFFAALPLMVIRAGSTSMTLPFWGLIDFGIFYTFILIPIGVIGISNMTNMLGGLNGLEGGLGLVSAIALAIFGFINGRIEVVIILAPLIGALIAFLIFNWYPSKIFPGDVGTFTIGTIFIATIIVGNIEKFGMFVFSLYILNFFLLFYHIWKTKTGKKQYVKFATVDKKGFIKAPNIGSIYWIFPRFFKITEKQNVMLIIGIQTIICLVSFWLVNVI